MLDLKEAESTTLIGWPSLWGTCTQTGKRWVDPLGRCPETKKGTVHSVLHLRNCQFEERVHVSNSLLHLHVNKEICQLLYRTAVGLEHMAFEKVWKNKIAVI